MSKLDMVEEIIAERPTELMIDILWSQAEIIKSLRAKLEEVPKENLILYRNEFVHRPMKVEPILISDTPVFIRGGAADEYFKALHN